MKPSHSNIASSKGFSLIEVIATIILVGILAAFFMHFMGTALNKSWKSVELVAGEADAEGKIEEIIAYYTSKINDNPDTALSDVASEFSGDAIMKFIVFNTISNDEETDNSGENRNLKVTIEAPGNNLTIILTKSRTDSNDPKVSY
jgi:prepilin-type N-terminal cleavage/methylation domain-containing protein